MRPHLYLALPLILTAACSSAGNTEDDPLDAILDSYATAVDGLHEAVDGHVDSALAETDLDAQGELEVAYLEDMAHVMEELGHAMDDVEGCTMGDESMGMADDVRTMMDSMLADAQAHVDAHAEHTVVDDCYAAEEALDAAMDGMLEELAAHHDHWHDDASMMCESHEDDGMGGSHDD